MRNLFQRVLAIVFATVALAANAGGPIGVCTPGNAVKYAGAGNITLNYDRGALGSRSNATAATIVNNAIALWTNVATSTVTVSRGSDLPVDVTTANYASYYSNFGDGLNPVIYDTDGTLTDLLLGTNAHLNILGFAGSGWSGCTYIEGRAVINGTYVDTDTKYSVIIAHEIGHLIGLDHTQLDGVQGLPPSNYPLMYPMAARSVVSLHEDDVAAISALYPDTTVAATYGTLTGTFVTAGGTPIPGANIWAQNTATGQLFSVVSDYLMQGTGYFKLLLTPGTYTLHAEAIDTSFTEGSGVGPYSGDLTGLSFQPPLYASANGGGSPMSPVTMSSQFTMTAGCNASITFRIDGSSTPGASCATPSAMTSPAPGSTLIGSTVTFNWDAGTGTITERYLMIGTTIGGTDIYAAYQGSALSRTVSGLPTNGGVVYVRLMSFIAGAWQTQNYTYTAYTVTVPTKSVITSPPDGSTLTGSSANFTWDAGNSVTARYISVGTTLGGSEIYGADQGVGLFRVVTGIPTDGRTIYVRLTSTVGGVPQNADYTYTAVFLAEMSAITSPANGTVLSSSSITFNWTAGTGVTERYLMVGTTSGGSQIYAGYQGSGTSRTVTGIPQDGSTVYVRLMSYIGGWQIANYTYVGGVVVPPSPSVMTSPANGSTLSSSSITFNWTAGSGVTERYLMVGTSLGGSQVYAGYQGSGTSRTVAGIPQNGSTVYVRLMSYINGNWQINDYSYMGGTAPPPATPSVMTSPTNGSTLSSSSITFNWSAGSGVTERYFMVGTSLGGSQIYAGYQGSGTSRTVSGIPQDGSTVYVRLMSWVNGGWATNDYTYSGGTPAAPTTPTLSDITSPTPGSNFASTTVNFVWTAGSGVTERYLMVGTTFGGSNLYAGYQGSGTSRTVTGVPMTGIVYVRLMSWVNGGWQAIDYVYNGGTMASAMTSPAPGGALGTSAAFTWNPGFGVTERYLVVGSTVGGSQYYAGYQGAGTTRTVTGLPGNGSAVYVRLMSWVNGGWVTNDYTYH